MLILFFTFFKITKSLYLGQILFIIKKVQRGEVCFLPFNTWRSTVSEYVYRATTPRFFRIESNCHWRRQKQAFGFTIISASEVIFENFLVSLMEDSIEIGWLGRDVSDDVANFFVKHINAKTKRRTVFMSSKLSWMNLLGMWVNKNTLAHSAIPNKHVCSRGWYKVELDFLKCVGRCFILYCSHLVGVTVVATKNELAHSVLPEWISNLHGRASH